MSTCTIIFDCNLNLHTFILLDIIHIRIFTGEIITLIGVSDGRRNVRKKDYIKLCRNIITTIIVFNDEWKIKFS
jgi:hypothetical protein